MIKIIQLFLVSLFFISTNTHAYKPLPQSSYEVVSSNGYYVFVMFVPSSKDLSYEKQIWNENKIEEILRINKNYSKSGMYLNDGSKELLWSVDWHSNNIKISNNGSHLVRIEDAVMLNHTDSIAIRFYEEGKQIKEYKLNQLIKNKPKTGTIPFPRPWTNGVFFNQENMMLTIKTVTNENLVFDVHTGDILLTE